MKERKRVFELIYPDKHADPGDEFFSPIIYTIEADSEQEAIEECEQEGTPFRIREITFSEPDGLEMAFFRLTYYDGRICEIEAQNQSQAIIKAGLGKPQSIDVLHYVQSSGSMEMMSSMEMAVCKAFALFHPFTLEDIQWTYNKLRSWDKMQFAANHACKIGKSLQDVVRFMSPSPYVEPNEIKGMKTYNDVYDDLVKQVFDATCVKDLGSIQRKLREAGRKG